MNANGAEGTRAVAAVATVIAVAMLAGCSSSKHTASPGTSSISSSATTAVSDSPSDGTSTGGPSKCLSGTFSVVFPGTDNPVRSACLRLGTSVTVELLALRGVTWSVPSVSDPSVASVSDQVSPPGTRHDHVTLIRPGTVTLTSASTYNPDPHGPPSRQWTLTLTIVP